MNVALYARVSTTDKGQDPEMQLRELREYCSRRGWDIGREYVDQLSAAKARPELNRLMADAHQRLFDAIVVWRFDRFARSTSHLLAALETFKSLGIEFCSLRESVDTTTPAGKLMFTLVAAIAEFERELIRERVRAGVAHARAKGKRLGRPRIAVSAARVASLRDAGHSYRHIASTLGVSVGTVHGTAHSAVQKSL